jgi:hypothetical protein
MMREPGAFPILGTIEEMDDWSARRKGKKKHDKEHTYVIDMRCCSAENMGCVTLISTQPCGRAECPL